MAQFSRRCAAALRRRVRLSARRTHPGRVDSGGAAQRHRVCRTGQRAWRGLRGIRRSPLGLAGRPGAGDHHDGCQRGHRGDPANADQARRPGCDHSPGLPAVLRPRARGRRGAARRATPRRSDRLDPRPERPRARLPIGRALRAALQPAQPDRASAHRPGPHGAVRARRPLRRHGRQRRGPRPADLHRRRFHALPHRLHRGRRPRRLRDEREQGLEPGRPQMRASRHRRRTDARRARRPAPGGVLAHKPVRADRRHRGVPRRGAVAGRGDRGPRRQSARARRAARRATARGRLPAARGRLPGLA